MWAYLWRITTFFVSNNITQWSCCPVPFYSRTWGIQGEGQVHYRENLSKPIVLKLKHENLFRKCWFCLRTCSLIEGVSKVHCPVQQLRGISVFVIVCATDAFLQFWKCLNCHDDNIHIISLILKWKCME